MRRTTLLIVWLILWLSLFATHLFPIRTRDLRLLLIAEATGIGVVALALVWRRRRPRIAFLMLTAFAGLFLLLPGLPGDPGDLRGEYVRQLQAFMGVPYVWGGETGSGIDCSGLVRLGWVEAHLRRGILTGNPRLLREGFFIWWRDCTARELKDGYRGRTRLLFTAASLNELDYSRLLPGDLAVTASGVHTLAYAGNHVWIEADTKEWKVIRVRAPSLNNGWFCVPVHIMRWRELDSTAIGYFLISDRKSGIPAG